MTSEDRLRNLLNRGVDIIDPASTWIAGDLEPERIEPGVKIYGGCRLAGKTTYIGKGTVLGRESPVTIEDCAVGTDVELKGGSFRGSVFLDRSSLGPGAQVREACLLEEEANGAHTVGLKQTILFPYVTLGSLINFCDCLMAGGTSRQDHSEVGSSYVHFNFTPNHDKATPSLIGDVSRGVMLDQKPIFLGGQGGLVGPARVGFGAVIAAGIVSRADVGEDTLVTGTGPGGKHVPYKPGLYPEVRRKVLNNITYLANLFALRSWYAEVRARFLSPVILRAVLAVLGEALTERVSRLKALAEKMPESVNGLRSLKPAGGQNVIGQEIEFHEAWPRIEELLSRLTESHNLPGNSEKKGQAAAGHNADGESLRDAFLQHLVATAGKDYLSYVRSLDAEARLEGTRWLSSVVDTVERSVLAYLPSFK